MGGANPIYKYINIYIYVCIYIYIYIYAYIYIYNHIVAHTYIGLNPTYINGLTLGCPTFVFASSRCRPFSFPPWPCPESSLAATYHPPELQTSHHHHVNPHHPHPHHRNHRRYRGTAHPPIFPPQSRRLHLRPSNRRGGLILNPEPTNTNSVWIFPPIFPPRSRRWLHDTSKRKLADVSIFFWRPPPSCFPGFTRGGPDDWSKQAFRIKKIGLIKTFRRVYPKKGEHAPGK